jgi:hypothetical protein
MKSESENTLGVDFRFNIILLQIKQQWDWGIKLSQLVDCPFPTLITTHNNDNKSAIYTNIVGHPSSSQCFGTDMVY